MEPRHLLAGDGVTQPDAYFTDVNVALSVEVSHGVLTNDAEPTGVAAKVSRAPSFGSVRLNGNGSFQYDPPPGFRGVDTWEYRTIGVNDSTKVQIFVGVPHVRINEIMAANVTSLTTRIRPTENHAFAGEELTPDWIEIANLTDIELELGGHSMFNGDNVASRWTFPAQTKLPPHGFLVVYASGQDVKIPARDETNTLHTSFRLDVTGEFIELVTPQQQLVHQLHDYGQQQADVSFGISAKGQFRHLTVATPSSQNSPDFHLGITERPRASVSRGFFDKPFQVTLETSSDATTILYTTDGSEPSVNHGTVYTQPIEIQTTTVLKSIAIRPQYLPSPVVAHSYIFPHHVLQQNNTGPTGGLAWGHAGPDYEVDPAIVNHTDPELRAVVDDLLEIPSISLAIDADLVFGERDGVLGIYLAGENTERPVTFEYLDGDTTVQTNSTIQIVGGSSPGRWRSDKLSMRVRFTEDAGESKLEHPLFGPEADRTLDTLVIDAHFNNTWHYNGGSDSPRQRALAQYLQDEFAADLQNAIGGYAPHSQHVHVFINGLYWGLHVLHERPDANFQASYQGGDADEYNIIKHTPNGIVQGTNTDYLAILDAIGISGNLSDEQYAVVTSLLDVKDFINYLLVNFYGANNDWDHHNWYASQNPLDNKWRFHSWDAEKFIERVFANKTGEIVTGAPTGIHKRLITHPEYALSFADAVQEHFHHGGVFTPETSRSIYEARATTIGNAIRMESARWGDNHIGDGAQVRYTRQHWLDVRNDLFENYFPNRKRIVLRQFERKGWFVTGAAPAFYVNGSPQHGGFVASGTPIEVSVPEGTVFFTTDGTDPRLIGGGVADQAHPLETAVNLDGPIQLAARARLSDGSWTPISRARFTPWQSASAENLKIVEVSYHPADATSSEISAGIDDADDFEFIELMNPSDQAVDLANVKFVQTVQGREVQGVAFDFASAKTQHLSPGERLVIVENQAAFGRRFGFGVNVAGQWVGGLNNRTERIQLLANDVALADFAYHDDWHPSTDGMGRTLVAALESQNADALSQRSGWRESLSPIGSPGESDGQTPPRAGDSNRDGVFNTEDLAFVFAAGKYEDQLANNATFTEGDWDGDGDFTSQDIVFAFQQGGFTF